MWIYLQVANNIMKSISHHHHHHHHRHHHHHHHQYYQTAVYIPSLPCAFLENFDGGPAGKPLPGIPGIAGFGNVPKALVPGDGGVPGSFL